MNTFRRLARLLDEGTPLVDALRKITGLESGDLKDDAVTTDKILNDAVTTAKILDANVTKAKLASDIYEEGIWTPVLSDGTNDATTHSFQTGHYTKIGRMVHFKCRIGTSNLGSVTGAIRVTGLPYTSDSATDSHSSCYVGSAGGLSITAGENMAGYVAPNTSYITLALWDGSNGPTLMQSTEWTADGSCYLAGIYYT